MYCCFTDIAADKMLSSLPSTAAALISVFVSSLVLPVGAGMKPRIAEDMRGVKPRFTEDMKSITVERGQDAVFTCVVSEIHVSCSSHI